jgi:hypothetical protein
VYASVAGFLWLFEVIVLIEVISSFVIEACPVKRFAEPMELTYTSENKTTAGDVVHSSELHLRIPMELVEDRALSLMTLGDGNARAARARA